MNVLGRYVSCFRIQHEALALLRAIRPSPRASAAKLYCCLAFRGIHVQEDIKGIMCRTGLHEGAVVNARKILDKMGLVEPDFQPGRGASYGHTILNVKTGKALIWEERPKYFQVPHSLMLRDQYTKLGGSGLVVYLAILAGVNKTGKHILPLTAAMLAERAGMTPPTLRKAMEQLTDCSAPLLKVTSREIHLLHPETGQELQEVDADGEKLTFVEAGSGKRIGMNELLTPETFKRYYGLALPGLDPAKTQQDVRCLFHSDATPSMSVNLEDGEWFCHACDFGGGMVHFEMQLLEIEDKRFAWQSIGKKLGVTLRGKKLGPPTSEHVWRDADGDVLFVRRRYAGGTARPYHPVAGKKMKLGMGSARGKHSFYNLPEVLEANTVVLVEGETKADPLVLLGLRDANGEGVAITTTGGANSWRSDFVELLKGKRVVILPDTDEPGIRYAEAVQASLDRVNIDHQTIYLEGHKDVRGFLEHNTPYALVRQVGNDWLRLPETQPRELVMGSIEDI
jgi:5S rRNA maturation endonuclease (ribonuclease M5)